MNKHDKSRKDSLFKTLCKAKEQADIALVYLYANNPDLEDINTMNLALEHINISLEHLGAQVGKKDDKNAH